jgi:hypothetical protein
MREILAFREEHAPDAAALYLRVMRGRKGGGRSKALEDYFCEVLLANPWTSPDFPSLICYEAGAAIGFLGVVPRPMLFRGRPIRAAVTSPFMVDRQLHRGPAAFELMSRFFRGPQDLSYVDGAAEATHIIWAAMGAHAANSWSFNWLRPLRPLHALKNYVDRAAGPLGLAGRAVMAAVSPMDNMLAQMPVKALRRPESTYESRPATVDEIFQCIQEIGWREPLTPAYDMESFRWLISQIAALRNTAGELRMATVYSPDGVLSGWCLYTCKPGGPAGVLQIGVRRRDQFDLVLRALFRDAWSDGASSVKGQATPCYLVNLTENYCLFRHPNTSVMFQSRDKDIADAIHEGKAALSRLDGECWMRFAFDPWT